MQTLSDVSSYIESRPDSALAVIRSMPHLTSRKAEAKKALLHSMALDKCYIDTTNVDVISPAVIYYRKHGTPEQKLKSLYYEGRIYSNAGRYSDAIFSYTEALSFLDQVDNYKYCGLLCSGISRVYNHTYCTKEALDYQEKAVYYFRLAGLKTHEVEAQYVKSQILVNENRHNEALELLPEILSVQDVDKRIVRKAKSLYAYLLATVPPFDFEKAGALFSEVISESGTLSQYAHWGAYAYVLFKQGDKHRALSVLDMLHSQEDRQATVVYTYWKSRIDEMSGDYKNALDEYKKTSVIQDSIIRESLLQSSTKAQRDYFELNSDRMGVLARNRQLWIYILILCALLFMSIVGLFAYHRIKIERDRSNSFAELAESLKNQLSVKDNALSGLRSEYSRMYKNQFADLASLCETYYQFAGSEDSQKRHIWEKVQTMLKDIRDDKEGQAHFEKRIDNSLDGIMTHFRLDFPKYSEEDYRFISYIFAGFDATTLLIIFNMPSQGSVYSKKNRIKNNILKSSSQYKEKYLEMLA